MKKTTNSRLLWYVFFFAFFAVFTFFVWYKIDSESGKSLLTLTPTWLSQFKKWLDLAWWVRLTYKIDFSKYESTYQNDQSQLLQLKKQAQDIILNQIDDRISTLWVSDYNAFIQKYSDGEYVVVEIWGIQDIDAAKKIIGKTVELEFKVPNESKENDPVVFEQRKKLSEEIFSQIVQDPSTMESVWATRWSEDVAHNTFDSVSLDQLPMIYRQNIGALTSTEQWKLYPTILSWTYHMSISQWEDGQFIPQSLEWFTMILYKGQRETPVEFIQQSAVEWYAAQNNLNTESTTLRSFDGKTQDVTYDAETKSVVYVWEQLIPGQQWYNAVVFKVLSGSDATKALENIKNGVRDWVEEVTSWWKSLEEMTATIPSFSYSEDNKITLHNELDGAYIVKVNNAKTAEETIYPKLSVSVSDEAVWKKMIDSLKTQTLYSFEDIFVSDKLQWLPAQDPQTNQILNGSFFELARVWQSQTGKPVVEIQFNEDGKSIFCNLTEQHVGKQMAIFVGGKLMTAPVIRDKICGGTAQIDGTFDIAGARELADDLNSGALPAPLLLSHEETVAPSLWQQALSWALVAGLVGLIIVYGIMFILYWWKKANIALIVLITFLIYLLWWIKMFGVVSSLSGIAAVILSLGMAVDSNVLMYERIREELKAWKSMKSAIEDWYERSWEPIKDGNITTWIIWLLLFIIWVNIFKWFGTMMMINMVIIMLVVTPLIKELLLVFYKDQK